MEQMLSFNILACHLWSGAKWQIQHMKTAETVKMQMRKVPNSSSQNEHLKRTQIKSISDTRIILSYCAGELGPE